MHEFDHKTTVAPPLPAEVVELLRVDWSQARSVRLPLGPPVEQSPSGIGISVICWCNNLKVLYEFLMPSLLHSHQIGSPDIELILIGPAMGCRNMGEAYNIGLGMATHENKAYLHQDVRIYDRTWADKVDMMLGAGVGALGLIGSMVDTGGAYFHAPPWEQVTAQPDLRVTPVLQSDASPVAVLDGMSLITRSTVPWATCYETTHMAVEDYCMRLRAEGLSIWTVGSSFVHASGGSVDARYWRSVQTFRRKWRRALPPGLVPVERYRRFADFMATRGQFNGMIALHGGWEVARLPSERWKMDMP